MPFWENDDLVIHDHIHAVIIGGGTAGLRAGAELSGNGLASLILSKGPPCRGIVGMNALLEEADDTRELFLGNTLQAAAGIGVKNLAEKMVDNSRAELAYMEQLGLDFLHDERYRPRRTSGNSAHRTVYTTDRTGEEIIEALGGAYTGQGGYMVRNRQAVSIITTDGIVSGVLAVDPGTAQFHLYPCSAVIVATGGLGNLYTHSTNNSSLSGDGLMLALDAGALLRDMEFVQFEPFALMLSGSDSFFSLSFLLEDKPQIYCEQGKAVFADGEVETLTKAQISLKLFERIAELRHKGATGRLYFDCTHIPSHKLQLHGRLIDVCSSVGFSLDKDPLPFTPAQHYLLGGIAVNERYETAVPGLFAAGEAAGGTHGADRLAGNSALDALVSGNLAAASVIRYLIGGIEQQSVEQAVNQTMEAARNTLDGILQKTGVFSRVDYQQNLQQLQQLMWDCAGIVRCYDNLVLARDGIKNLKELQTEFIRDSPVSLSKNNYSPDALGMYFTWSNQLAVAEMIVASAMMREESRGVHYRSDYPYMDPSLEKSIMVRRVQGSEGYRIEWS